MVPWPTLPTAATGVVTLLAALFLEYLARPHRGAVAALARAYLYLALVAVVTVAAQLGMYIATTGVTQRACVKLLVATSAWSLLALDELTRRATGKHGARAWRLKALGALILSVLAVATPLAITPLTGASWVPGFAVPSYQYRVGPLAILLSLSVVAPLVLAFTRCFRPGATTTARSVGRGMIGWTAFGVADVVRAILGVQSLNLGPLGAMVLAFAVVQAVVEGLREQERQREALRVALAAKTREADTAAAALVEAARLASLGRLAAGVAHEVNNPAGFILANLTQLRDRLGRTDDAAARALDDSLAGVRRIAEAVSALRVLSQGSAASVETVRLDRLAESTLLLAQPSIASSVEVRRELLAQPCVSVQPGALMRVVLELLSLATEVGAAGKCTVLVRVAQRGDFALLEVIQCDGTVPAGAHDPARQAGLDAARRAVEAQGGTLAVERNALTAAWVLRVQLPAVAGPPVTRPNPAVVPTATATRPRVLIIDDEPAMLRVLGRLVGRTYEVLLAGTPAEAAAYVRKHPADVGLVLCDVIMPDANGVDLRDALVQIAPALHDRFTFMTGGGLPEALLRRIDTARCPVLEKPIEPEELEAHLRARLGR